MNLMDGLTSETAFTVAGLVLLIYLSGAIAQNEFGLPASKVGLVVAAVLTLMLMIRPLVPTAAFFINLLVSSYGTVLIAYSLAYGSSGIIKLLRARWALGSQPVDAGDMQARAMKPVDTEGWKWTW